LLAYENSKLLKNPKYPHTTFTLVKEMELNS